MTLKQAQKMVDNYIREVGVKYFSELTNLALLNEEVGELSRHFARRFGDQSYKEGEDPEGYRGEIGDILFVLICIANQTGVSLEEELQRTIEKNTKRDLNRHKNNPKLK